MSVASTRLGYKAALTTTHYLLYTVPANRRTIVKCVTATNLDTVARQLVFNVANGGVTLFEYLLNVAAGPTNVQSETWLPWIVLNAGDEIHVWTSAGTFEVSVSGAELVI